MTGLNPLANITLRDISCNLSLHASPPEVLFQILVHLGTTRVHREFGQMGLIQYLLTKLMVLGYNDTLVKP
jgi:hypothetical protein